MSVECITILILIFDDSENNLSEVTFKLKINHILKNMNLTSCDVYI